VSRPTSERMLGEKKKRVLMVARGDPVVAEQEKGKTSGLSHRRKGKQPYPEQVNMLGITKEGRNIISASDLPPKGWGGGKRLRSP